MYTLNISKMSYNKALSELKKTITDKNLIACHIDFWADHSQSKIIRDYVWLIFDVYSISIPWKWRFMLITDELVNNAIEHGSNQGDIDTCIITAWFTIERWFYITLEVHDTGKWENTKDQKYMEKVKIQKLNEHNNKWVYMEKRGRGLFYITEKLVDKLSFTSSSKGGLAVKIEKNIPIQKISQ